MAYTAEEMEADNLRIYGIIEGVLTGNGITVTSLERDVVEDEYYNHGLGYMLFTISGEFSIRPVKTDLSEKICDAITDQDGSASEVEYPSLLRTTVRMVVRVF